jgi:Immunity protein Imm1
MLAHWSDFESSHSRKVDTPVQALDLISELTSSVTTPAMVEFRDDSVGLAFGYAVGRERTVLTFQYTNDPPYYISLGNPEETGVEWFCYAQQYSEYVHYNLIEHGGAQQALQEFYSTQELPASVKWERL